MKIEAVLLLVAIAMSFLSGLNFLSFKSASDVVMTDSLVQLELNRFNKNNSHLSIFRPFDFIDNIDPVNLLPYFHRIPRGDLLSWQNFNKSCREPQLTSTDPRLKKLWAWQRYLCGQKLPDQFFETVPYFHPSGKSYVSLFKNDSDWLVDHFKQAHVLDLKRVPLEKLNSPFRELSQLGWPDLYDLVEDKKVVINENFVFVKEDGDKDLYRIFNKKIWDSFWRDSNIRPSQEKKCSFKSHSLCWEEAESSSFLNKKISFQILLYLSILFTLLMLWLLLKKLKQRAADEERLKFSLEMLAHEIRTPVTNLSMNIEILREDYDSQRPDQQTSILRIFDQIERLKRIINSSKHYLSKDLHKKILKANFIAISLPELLNHSLDPFLDEIELGEIPDINIKTDPFWAGICIKNVVENALKHGEKPVRVSAHCTKSTWLISVQDQGSGLSSSNPERISKGLGLGLKLVGEIMPELKGTLEMSENPTLIKLLFEMQL